MKVMRTFFFALALTTAPLSRLTSEGPAQAERNQWGLGPSKSHELEWMQMNYSELLTLQAFMAQGTNSPELPRTLLGHPHLNRPSPPHQQPTHNSHTNAPNPHGRNNDATRPNPPHPFTHPKPKRAWTLTEPNDYTVQHRRSKNELRPRRTANTTEQSGGQPASPSLPGTGPNATQLPPPPSGPTSARTKPNNKN